MFLKKLSNDSYQLSLEFSVLNHRQLKSTFHLKYFARCGTRSISGNYFLIRTTLLTAPILCSPVQKRFPSENVMLGSLLKFEIRWGLYLLASDGTGKVWQ